MYSVEINYLAVLVCGIIAMPIGAIWYGPVFGKAWMKEVGLTEEDVKNFNPLKTYGLTFLAHLMMALIVAYFLELTGASTVVDGLRIALTAWVGFIGASMFINGLFTGKSAKLFTIDGGYHLLNMIIYGILLALWK